MIISKPPWEPDNRQKVVIASKPFAVYVIALDRIVTKIQVLSPVGGLSVLTFDYYFLVY